MLRITAGALDVEVDSLDLVAQATALLASTDVRAIADNAMVILLAVPSSSVWQHCTGTNYHENGDTSGIKDEPSRDV
jgi:glycerol-3-phosphate dehydrogenase